MVCKLNPPALENALIKISPCYSMSQLQLYQRRLCNDALVYLLPVCHLDDDDIRFIDSPDSPENIQQMPLSWVILLSEN